MFNFPKTTPNHYLTGTTALNIPFPEEGYGDWHFIEAFYGRDDKQPKLFVAGEGEDWNTNKIFGNFGVNECSELLRKLGLAIPRGEKVYSAGHYRAVLDMLYRCVKKGYYPHHIDLDQWFDTQEQKNTLFKQAKIMRNYLNKDEWNIVEKWIQNQI